MFERVCRAAVEIGRFRFAWVGAVELDGNQRVILPLAQWGTGDGYLDAFRIALDEAPYSNGPAASALRTQEAIVSTDIASDPRMVPWRDAAIACGFRSCGAFPFRRGAESHGVLGVYSTEVGFIDPLERYLLEGIAEDLGFALDALDRERARADFESRLVESENRHRMQFEIASDGIFLADAHHRFIDVNPAGCAMLGYERVELLAMHIADVIAPADLAAAPVRADGPKGVSFFSERVLRRKDGTTVDAEIHGVRLANGGMQSVTRDVSERKRRQAADAAVERMMSLGRLAHGVGHEINNPLAYLSLSLELANAKLDSVPSTERAELATALVNARDAAERIKHIVQALVPFGRGEPEIVQPTPLARVIDSAITLTANRLRHVARVEVDIDVGTYVLANEFKLAQVFVNLLLNAAEAMENATGEPQSLRISGHAVGGDRFVVAVADSGPGIPPAALERVFDPFFTTKAVGRGTGIGLSISKAFLASFDATLDVANDDPRGAVFRVGLRVAPGRTSSVPAPSAPRCTRRLRVLAVDDEPLLGRLIARALNEHDVVVVQSVPAAIELCEREDFDVILCDVMLPLVPGEALLIALKSTKPELARRMIFMTGGTFTDASQTFLDSVEAPVLSKPFSTDALRAALAPFAAKA